MVRGVGSVECITVVAVAVVACLDWFIPNQPNTNEDANLIPECVKLLQYQAS